LPPVLVRLPALIAALFPDADRVVELPVGTVDEMMCALDARWPGMRDCFCDSTPAIRRHINVFVDGKRVALHTPLPPGADVFILTAISGGWSISGEVDPVCRKKMRQVKEESRFHASGNGSSTLSCPVGSLVGLRSRRRRADAADA
jgi:hypothetical protein